MQGKKCISLKKSKALMFRIKCVNKILPTKDICYLRNSKLYKSRKCIAYFREDETFHYLAECEIYEKKKKKKKKRKRKNEEKKRMKTKKTHNLSIRKREIKRKRGKNSKRGSK